MPIRCYTQRFPNPFRGVMNVIEFEDATACVETPLRRELVQAGNDNEEMSVYYIERGITERDM